MAWFFEEEKEGLEGEPARTRVFVKLSLLYWAIFLTTWHLTTWTPLRAVALIFLLGALYGTTRATFHILTVAVTKLPEHAKPLGQVVIAAIVALIPFVYFLPQWFPSEEVQSIAYKFVTSWTLWLTTIFIGYVAYAAGNTFHPLLPFRRYLTAVGIAFAIVFIASHGVFEATDEGESFTQEIVAIDPESPIGRSHMAVNYLRIISACYIGLTVSLMKNSSHRHDWMTTDRHI